MELKMQMQLWSENLFYCWKYDGQIAVTVFANVKVMRKNWISNTLLRWKHLDFLIYFG